MMQAVLPDYLAQDPDGYVRVAGHRIGLHHVVRAYNEGYSPEMLLGEFPTLSLSLIHKLIAFYLDHVKEVDSYVEAQGSAVEAAAAAQAEVPTLAELRRRMSLHERAEAS